MAAQSSNADRYGLALTTASEASAGRLSRGYRLPSRGVAWGGKLPSTPRWRMIRPSLWHLRRGRAALHLCPAAARPREGRAGPRACRRKRNGIARKATSTSWHWRSRGNRARRWSAPSSISKAGLVMPDPVDAARAPSVSSRFSGIAHHVRRASIFASGTRGTTARTGVSHLPRLVAHRKRQCRRRPPSHAARVRAAARERQCGTCAGPRHVRKRLARRCRAPDRRLAAQL